VRALRWLGRGLLLAVFLVLALVGWLLGSEAGLRVLADQLESRGWLVAADVEGKVLGRLEVKRAMLRVPGMELAVDRFILDWRPWELLRGRLHVSELTGAGLCLAMQPSGPSEPSGRYAGLALPLDVQVDRLRVEDLALRRGEDMTLLVRSLKAGVQLAGGMIRLERLELDTPWATLDAAGQWGLAPDAVGDLTLHWQARLAGLKAPLEGAGHLSGTLQSIAFEQRLAWPVTARLQGTLQPLTAGLPWRASLDMDALEPNALLDALPALGTWSGHLEAEGDLEGADLKALELHQGERRLHAEGRVDWAGAMGLDARLAWQNLAWPPAGPAALESPRGRLELRGALTGYRFAGQAKLSAPGQPAAGITLRGTGDLAHLAFDELSARAMQGVLEAKGEVHWASVVSDSSGANRGLPSDKPEEGRPSMGDIRWQADLVARDLRPEVLLPAWPGRLSASAHSEGTLRAGRTIARIEVERLHGELRGHPVEASLRGRIDGTRVEIENLDLRSGRSRGEARGSLGEALDLTLALDSPDLAELLPGASGALRGKVQLAGSPRAPRVQGVFEGQRLGWQDWRVDTLTLRAGGGREAEAPLSLRLTAGRIGRGGAPVFERASLELRGTPAAHKLTLALAQEAKGAELRLAGTGRWDGAQARLRLDEGRVSRTPLGEWHTLSAVELVAGARNIQLPRWCWGQDAESIPGRRPAEVALQRSSAAPDGAVQARLCLAGRWTAGEGGSVRLNLEGIDLAWADPWLAKQRLRLSGQLAGEATLEAPAKGPLTLSAWLAGERAILHVPANRRGEWLEVPLEVARMEARLGGGDSRLEAVLRRDASNRLEARLSLPGYRLKDGLPAGQGLDGVIELHYREPLMLAALLPALREPQGVLAGRLQLAGTLGQPSLFGGAQLSAASVVLPELGIRVEEGELILRAGPGPYLTVQGGARLGRGRASLDGRIDLTALPAWHAEFGVKGVDLTALRLPEASMQASPDLKLILQPGEMRVSGRVEVPEALFDLGAEVPAAARISPDVRIIGAAEADRPHALRTHIELVLGERVRVQGKGFSGRIKGRLEIIDHPGLPGPIGRGELSIVDGRYKAYGQDLAIEQGRLIYTDMPLDDPALDIRAVRRGILDGTVAGARISGRASRPQLSLFSEPAKAQAEVLAYLITGRPLRQGSGSDAALMVQAARAAGFVGGDILAGQIGSAFGLQEAAIESDAGTRELSLVLGRYLTPRLYLRYVQGLEQGLQTFLLRYELTRHFHVQAQSGVKAGVDVFYSFER